MARIVGLHCVFRRDRSARAAWLASAVWLAAAAAAPLTPPPPGGDPRAIDLAADPVLRFAADAVPADPFLARLAEAVVHHSAVAAAAAEAQATQGVRTQVRSRLLPQLDIELVASRQLARDFGSRDTIVESLQPRGRTDAVVTGDQLLFDWGATSGRIAAADARTGAARAEVERAASDTALGAVAAWYAVVEAEAQQNLAAAAIARHRAILDQIGQRIDHGLGADGDRDRALAMLAAAEGAAARAGRDLGAARARYREAFGGDAPVLPLARPLAPPSTAQSSDAAAALARRAPAVVAALKRAEGARRDWRAARAEGLPRLSAGVTGTRYAVFAGSDYEVRGQLVLRQSLSAGGRQRGLVDEAEARSRAAAADADRIGGDSERDAAAAFAEAAADGEALAALRDAYVATRRTRDAFAEEYRVSRGTLIELLRAEQDYRAAASALVGGAIDLDLARFTLLARTGELLPVAGIRLDIEGARP